MRNGFRKITVQVDSEKDLKDLYTRAQAMGLTAYLVVDYGLTEFNGPTTTCLAIGPDWDERVDPLTKNLKLY